MKKYFVAVLVVVLAVFVFTGCATTRTAYQPVQETKSSYQAKSKQYVTVQEAMNVLDVKSLRNVKSCLDGYKTSKFEYAGLTVLAGIYAGTVEVWCIEKRYVAYGSYSLFQHPEAMQRVLREADINKDKIITKEERYSLAIKLYLENAK